MSLVYIVTIFCLSVVVSGRQGFGPGEQDWGYVQVREGARMFWWLYYTTSPEAPRYEDRPLLIWLQGGPGASATGYGNFAELGPLDLNLRVRNTTWVKDYNVLFIDNPVGTGFSHAAKYSKLAKNNAEIAQDLLTFMRAFLQKNPSFQNVPTYILSESYGGKMAAEFALVWHKAESNGTIKSKLRGVGIGDAWISPVDSVQTWAPFLLQTGMIDKDGFDVINQAAVATKKAAESEDWARATALWSMTENIIFKVANNIDFYNILTRKTAASQKSKKFRGLETGYFEESENEDVTLEELMNGPVRKKLGLNTVWSEQDGQVFNALRNDFMKPVINIVENLLNDTDLKVFVYNGQLDLIVDTPGTVAWVEKMNWKNSKGWKSCKREALVVNNIIEGYAKKYENFSLYWIIRAGHMVPADNPAAMSALLKELTST